VKDGDRLSQVVLRQLHELHVDPGEMCKPHRHVASRLKRWSGEHREIILLLAIGATMVLFVSGVAFAVAASLRAQPSSVTAGLPLSATVSLDDVAVQVQPPDYRRVSTVESILLVHLDVRNTTDTRTVLSAGDLLLSDARGAVFPPSWQDAYGRSVDGVADPNHTLVALEPGGEAAIGLQFLVLTDGPFDLRCIPDSTHAVGGIPTLSLSRGE
jgi:hypothetical protein